MLDINNILEENRKRNELINAPYNPVTGYGSTSIERESVFIDGAPIEDMFLPVDCGEFEKKPKKKSV